MYKDMDFLYMKETAIPDGDAFTSATALLILLSTTFLFLLTGRDPGPKSIKGCKYIHKEVTFLSLNLYMSKDTVYNWYL